MTPLGKLTDADIDEAVRSLVKFGSTCQASDRDSYSQVFANPSVSFDVTPINGERFQVSLPNRRSFTIGVSPASDVAWSGELGRDTPSTRLWINSLEYLQLLPLDGFGLRVVEAVVGSLSSYLARDAMSDPPKRGSLDHEVALQLRTCCILLCRKEGDGNGDLHAVLSPLVQLCMDMAERHDLFSTSNHGVMLATNVLRAAILFPSCLNRPLLIRRALDSLIASFTESVSEDGVVSENTPEYQRFWIELLDDLVSLFSWAGLEGRVSSVFRQYRSGLLRVFKIMLLPDGSVPPLGDSSGGPQRQYVSSPGTLIIPANGLAIVSDSSTYLAFVCGASGVIHKQLDDASLYVWHKGYALLTDGGLLDYDQTNEKSVMIRGQLGHSAAQYGVHDSLNAVKVCSFATNTRRVVSSFSDLSSSSQLVFEGSVKILSGPELRRTVTKGSGNCLTIEDCFSECEGTGPVSRFLLTPGSAPVISDDHVTFTRGPEGSSVWGILGKCLANGGPSNRWSVEAASLVWNRVLRDDAYRVFVEPHVQKGPGSLAIGLSFGDCKDRLVCHHCGWTP